MSRLILFLLTITVIVISFLIHILLQAPVVEKFLFSSGTAYYLSFAFKAIEMFALVLFLVMLGKATARWHSKLLSFVFFMFMFTSGFLFLYMGQMWKWERELHVSAVKTYLDDLKISLIELKHFKLKDNPAEFLKQMQELNSGLKKIYSVNNIRLISSEVANIGKKLNKPLEMHVVKEKYLGNTIQVIDNTLKHTNEIISRVQNLRIEETIASRFRIDQVELVVHLFNVLMILVMEIFFILSTVYIVRQYYYLITPISSPLN